MRECLFIPYNWFERKHIKKMLREEHGREFVFMYLKLLITSARGTLYFDGIYKSLAEEFALLIDEEGENINILSELIEYLFDNRLLEYGAPETYELTEYRELTDEAEI